MKIRALAPIPVAMPLSKPIKMAGVEIRTADNVLVRLETDEGVIGMLRTLISDPSQGAVFIARQDGKAVGVANLDWKWSSLKGARIGYLEDLFVDPNARGGGIADALIQICADRCRELGMPAMEWLTAPDNHRAQKVYNRTGAEAGTYVEYDLEL
jgi:GNAT superfamily N-acetyltransferase